MTCQIYLRPATRADQSTLSRIANDANGNSALHKRLALYQEDNPISYYQWRHGMTRRRFVDPSARTIVACSSATDEMVGFATWNTEGESSLMDQWTREADSWSNWLERGLLKVEEAYIKYVSDRSLDWQYMRDYRAAAAEDKAVRPPSLHLALLCVDPPFQGHGIGRDLVEWGFRLADEQGLPVVLESLLEARGFYESLGFCRLQDMVVLEGTEDEYSMPILAREARDRAGVWLEEVDQGRWQWKTQQR